MYLYVQSNPDWNNKVKYGFTKNYTERLLSSHEQHSFLSSYTKLYKIEYTETYLDLHLYNECDKIISIGGRNLMRFNNINNYMFRFLAELEKYLINDGGSTEFLDVEGIIYLELVILYELPKLGINIIKEYNDDELRIINERIRESLSNKGNAVLPPQRYTTRQYQEKIIEYSLNELKTNKKVYIELATGGGKTFIVYNIMNHLFNHNNIKNVLIMSPLIKINNQNTSDWYLNILNIKPKIHNYSNCDDLQEFETSEYKILTFCSASKNKNRLWNIINKMERYMVWFDEAHHTVEQSAINNCQYTIKLLQNAEYAVFTSASPNKQLILDNTNIFGKLCHLITTRQLINLGYLCDIKTYIFDIERENVKIINYMINTFLEQNKKFGFSFHSRQKNAFNLFRIHCELYNILINDDAYKKLYNNRLVKPFLLIGYVTDNQLAKQINTIKLSYKYNDINLFEKTEYSIGYVVQQYSIGYDFPKLDFITFPDNKTSHQDITQCIGRGIRMDPNNKNKYLSILLPAYINESNIEASKYRYKQIINVLKYLLNDVEVTIENIEFQESNSASSSSNTPGVNYEGVNLIKAKLLQMLELNKRFTYDEFVSHLISNNITNSEQYYEYYNKLKENNDSVLEKIPENPFTEYKDIKWRDMDNNRDNYYTYEECVEVLRSMEKALGSSEKTRLKRCRKRIEKVNLLNSIDGRLPNEYYDYYYGKNKIFPLIDN